MLSLVVIGKDIAPYAGTCMESVARSRMRDFEVVFVDDGSTDGSSEVVESYRHQLPALHMLRHDTPHGLAGARNAGLARCSGEHIAMLDGDDWLGPDALAHMDNILRQTRADFVRVDHVQVAGKHRSVRRAPEQRRGVVLEPRSGIGAPGSYDMTDYPFTWAGSFHRRLLDAGLLWQNPNLKTAEDRPWIWRLHLQAGSYVVTTLLQHFYRRGLPTSLSQTGDSRQLSYLDAFSEVMDIVERDHEAAALRPKAVLQFLAIAHAHLQREERLTFDLRASQRSRLAAFIRDRDLLNDHEVVDALGPDRLGDLTNVADRH